MAVINTLTPTTVTGTAANRIFINLAIIIIIDVVAGFSQLPSIFFSQKCIGSPDILR